MKSTKLFITLLVFLVAIAPVFAAPITGTVTDSATGNPIDAALIEVFSTTGTLLNSTNSVNGTYSVDSVGTGLRIVNASKFGYDTQSIPKFVGALGTTIDFALGPIPAYTLSGTETNSLVGVNVKLKQGGAIIYETQTIAGGAYSLSVLNGTYTFEASLAGYDIYTSTVNVAGNTVYNFALNVSVTTGTFYGYVYNGSISNLLNGVTIAFKQGGATPYTTTTINGYYTINVSQGTYNITASLSGYYDNTQTGPVSLGQQVQVDFNMSSTPPTQPGQPGPPGGNGGPPGEEKPIDYSRVGAGRCDPEWQCGEWGSCIDGIQTRTCVDTEECGSDEDKPVEKRSCITPAVVQEKPGEVPKITGLAFLVDLLKKGSIQTAILVGVVVILIVAVSYLYLRKGFGKGIKKKK